MLRMLHTSAYFVRWWKQRNTRGHACGLCPRHHLFSIVTVDVASLTSSIFVSEHAICMTMHAHTHTLVITHTHISYIHTRIYIYIHTRIYIYIYTERFSRPFAMVNLCGSASNKVVQKCSSKPQIPLVLCGSLFAGSGCIQPPLIAEAQWWGSVYGTGGRRSKDGSCRAGRKKALRTRMSKDSNPESIARCIFQYCLILLSATVI